MKPEPGDIWLFHHPYRDEQDCLVLIYKFLNETNTDAQKNVLVYWGYDMLTDQYDEWLFTEESLQKCWKRMA